MQHTLDPVLLRSEMAHAFDLLGKNWRMAYITTSLLGVSCAVEAGMGISLLPKVASLELLLHMGQQQSAQTKILADYLTKACDEIFEQG
ncbi:MAG: hypothetical protein JKY55_16670 [Aliivibrio sp.]|uniref:hypothetical protein n=1 Tax=Aliivibrio sp. TaxID=1872443 RepID=UPI001A5E38C1|nr:hypothetical protein [Aliivibrio sp.]